VLLRDRISGMKLELNWYPRESKHAVPYLVGEGLDNIAFRVDDPKKTFRELSGMGLERTEFGPRWAPRTPASRTPTETG